MDLLCSKRSYRRLRLARDSTINALEDNNLNRREKEEVEEEGEPPELVCATVSYCHLQLYRLLAVWHVCPVVFFFQPRCQRNKPVYRNGAVSSCYFDDSDVKLFDLLRIYLRRSEGKNCDFGVRHDLIRHWGHVMYVVYRFLPVVRRR